MGGGSALDLGKAVAALMTNKGDVYDYMEVVGKGLPIQNAPLPSIAVPTTRLVMSDVYDTEYQHTISTPSQPTRFNLLVVISLSSI